MYLILLYQISCCIFTRNLCTKGICPNNFTWINVYIRYINYFFTIKHLIENTCFESFKFWVIFFFKDVMNSNCIFVIRFIFCFFLVLINIIRSVWKLTSCDTFHTIFCCSLIVHCSKSNTCKFITNQCWIMSPLFSSIRSCFTF